MRCSVLLNVTQLAANIVQEEISQSAIAHNSPLPDRRASEEWRGPCAAARCHAAACKELHRVAWPGASGAAPVEKECYFLVYYSMVVTHTILEATHNTSRR